MTKRSRTFIDLQFLTRTAQVTSTTKALKLTLCSAQVSGPLSLFQSTLVGSYETWLSQPKTFLSLRFKSVSLSKSCFDCLVTKNEDTSWKFMAQLKNPQAQKAKLMPENPVASGTCGHLDPIKWQAETHQFTKPCWTSVTASVSEHILNPNKAVIYDKYLVFHQAFQGYKPCVSIALTVWYNFYLSVQQKLNEINTEKLS